MFDGEAWLNLPHDQETAKELLKFAQENGYSVDQVRSSEDGYFVPAPLVDLLYPTPTPQEA